MPLLLYQVPHVYIGSFWDDPLGLRCDVNDVNRSLFELHEEDLLDDIQSLPRNAILRKLNDFAKRARLAKVFFFTTARTPLGEMPVLQ